MRVTATNRFSLTMALVTILTILLSSALSAQEYQICDGKATADNIRTTGFWLWEKPEMVDFVISWELKDSDGQPVNVPGVNYSVTVKFEDGGDDIRTTGANSYTFTKLNAFEQYSFTIGNTNIEATFIQNLVSCFKFTLRICVKCCFS